MSISSSEKIFIDPREEITFIVERLLGAEKDRVILVVPQNSLLLSSLVSIDILFRKLVRTKKLAIIVTEDEYGKSIASKAGFVVVDKVSHITNEQWNLGNNRKSSIKEILDERKKALLANISGESRDLEELPEVPSAEGKEEFYVTEQEIEENIEENNGMTYQEVAEAKEDKLEEVEDAMELVEQQTEPIDLDPMTATEPEIITEEDLEQKELESSLKKYAKPRREVKEIELDGIKLVSGGDIKSYIDSKESAKMADSNSFTQMAEDINIDRKIKKIGSSSFTGKDFTKKVTDKGGIKSLFSSFNFKRRKTDFRDENDFIKKKNRKKVLIGAFIGFLIFFSLGFYVLAFQLSTVDVTLTLRAQDITTSATVLLSTTAETLSLESPITIPAKEYSISADNLSISKTGTADGDSKRGAKAKGVVTIYNLKTESVTLPVGTKFKNVTNGLTYLSTTEVVLDPATVTANIKSPSTKDNIALEAETFGTQFNIEVSEKTRFSIEEFNTEEELSATAFQSFLGGTEESFTSVSKDNYDKLKEAIVPDLKKQGLERLKALTESGYQLIEGTVTYDESKSPESMPKVGDEAKDKTFNLTVQIGIKGLAVKTSDLTEAVSNVLKNNAQGTSGTNLQVDDIMNPLIEKVEKSGEDYIVTVSSKGSVKTQITPEQMKKDIAGLTIQQANDYFRLIDYIQDYKVSFNPILIPEGLKRVPSDTSRISIKTR